ncbi:family 2A encapsulin nanocompartment cargo protein cysteine desulfurase [Halomonas sp. SpR8]|uniref:family 2A encapsulin nanocompartment cargo protein cysteine desulfurase n=1 Tax=Halomonas sp. SpR8 TaxID=3050463 RepID=UPI0027E3F301|nr:family 2A encapsulin nanocompartment cargo protein cysteine desulfurase [Halomonas sp. SpR8]MDQ7730986.1 family 2A encapsulin nanocompartment cargo protein cysteine desulfurase [Halomonas sp. SpR8]
MSYQDTQPLATPPPVSAPATSEAPLNADVLRQMANAFFSALPGETPELPSNVNALPTTGSEHLPHLQSQGAQAPVNVAPGGSPLATPSGLGVAAPGSFIPQGQVPGANLLPSSPSALPSLSHRAPALAPHSLAGNGVPDSLVTTLPAYEPRLGGVLGTPPGESGQPLAKTPYYFLENGMENSTTPAHPSVLGSTLLSDTALGNFATQQQEVVHHSGNNRRFTEPPSAVPDTSDYYFLSTPAPANKAPHTTPNSRVPFNVETIRRDFPILNERVNGKPLVWFDNAATTQKPQAVIDRLAYFYAHENSNIHRAAHELAARATDAYEKARETVRRFINAPDVNNVIFVRGTTEAINLVAKSWGGQNIKQGDEIIVSHLEHHANIVPWQQLAAEKGAIIKVIPVDDSGQVRLDEYQKLLSDRTKIVAVTQVSNALGTVVPVKEIVSLAKRVGARTLVDGAQSVSHLSVDVQDLGADFFVFSGHKIFGPTGIGALWGSREALEETPPWQGGGNMIADVTFDKTAYQSAPNKYEAGTGNIADAVGLGAALEYIERIGLENIARYEHELLVYAMNELADIPGVRLIGTAADKASVASFLLDGYDTEEVGEALNEEGIAVRTGHHCAQPILRRFGTETTIRPSFAFYNTFDEIDRLIAVVSHLAGQRRTH